MKNTETSNRKFIHFADNFTEKKTEKPKKPWKNQ